MWSDDATESAAYDTMLRVVSGSVPEHAVSWDAFHARLTVRAELSLARLRSRAMFESAAVDHVSAATAAATLLPGDVELLIPLGDGVPDERATGDAWPRMRHRLAEHEQRLRARTERTEP